MIVPTRRAADGSRVLALPKGHVDPGETPLQAAAARGARGDRASSPSRCASSARRATGTGATGARSASRCRSSCSSYVGGDTADHDDEVEEARWIALERGRRRELSHAAEREMVALRARPTWRAQRPVACRAVQVLNFYSTIFADELKRGRKTATIRLGDKSGKYRKNQAVLVTIGYQYSPRERIFEAVIDQVEVMKLADLSPRDIKHDNPEFRRHEELINFLEQIYGRAVSLEDTVTVVRFSQILDKPVGHDRGDEGLRRRPELGARARPAVARQPCWQFR